MRGMWLIHFPKIVFNLADIIFQLKLSDCKAVSGQSTHGAEFAADDEDPALIQHAGVQMQHVVHIHSHKIFCQISLGERRKQGLWLILFVLITKVSHKSRRKNQKAYVLFPCPTPSTWEPKL